MFRLIKMIKDKGRWRIFKLKLIDARLYFVSIFVGLLTGLVAVPYHYLLQFFFNLRHDFFDSRPKWYWYIPLFLLMWGILVFVSWLVKKMPLITGGGIPQTRGVINLSLYTSPSPRDKQKTRMPASSLKKKKIIQNDNNKSSNYNM